VYTKQNLYTSIEYKRLDLIEFANDKINGKRKYLKQEKESET